MSVPATELIENARPLVLVGGGEHAVVVADAARAAGWKLHGYSEAKPNRTLEDAFGIPFLGEDGVVARAHADCAFVLGVGDQHVRTRVLDLLLPFGLWFATIIHPSAVVAQSARIDVGTVVLAGAVVNPGARVGAHVIVNTGAIIEHDVVLETLAHACPAVAIGGGARISAGAVVGLGARVRDHITVGRNAVVGMGAVVVADVPAGELAVGVPARSRSKRS